jgi:AraC-like DNA-binding protein
LAPASRLIILGDLFLRANPLLDRRSSRNGSENVAEPTTQQVLPTAMGFAAKQAVVALRNRHVEIAPLLRRAGLSEHDFALAENDDNPTSHRLSAVAQVKFLDYAAEAMNDSAFGLHLIEHTDPRDAGIYFYVASAAKDINEALGLYARYFRIVNEAVRLKLTRKPNGVALQVEFIGLPRHLARQTAEFGMAALLKGLRVIAGQNIHPTQVSFAHMRSSGGREFERFYGCPVEFGASSDLFEFSNDAVAIPLLTADPKLLKALEPFCEMAAKERHTAAGTLRATVENEIEKWLPHSKAQKGTIAKAVALSTRTLSRKLADEGTTYEEVVDQLRRSLALQYVQEPSMSHSQIAWLLGYEGSSSFNHAFRRWTGRSPSAARNQKLLPAPLA